MSDFVLSVPPRFSTLVELLQYRAQIDPDRIAYTFLPDGEHEQASLTFKQLDDRARQIAVWLQRNNFSGTRVLFLFPDPFDFITTMFGCWYAGVTAVPTVPPRPNQSLATLETLAHDAQLSCALVAPSVLATVQNQLEHSPTLKAMAWLTLDQIPADIQPNLWQMPALTAETLTCLMYTSGSTDVPKGVMLGHRNMMWVLATVAERTKRSKDNVQILWVPLYHIAGLMGLLLPLGSDTKNIVIPTATILEQPARWLNAITRFRATYAGGFNFMFQYCIDRVSPAERTNLDLSCLQALGIGGEGIRIDLLEQFSATFATCGFQRQAFMPAYGLTESTGSVAGGELGAGYTVYNLKTTATQNHVELLDPADTRGQKFVGCGKSTITNVVIVNPQTLTRCAPDEIGEIWVSGPAVTQGYWNRPTETAETFHAYLADTGEGPFLRTGDMGFIGNGQVVVTARIKDIIIIHGKNYYSQDFEKLVSGCHPALQPGGSAAFAVTIDGDERLAIVHELKANATNADLAQVVQSIRRKVAEDKLLPVAVVALTKAGTLSRTNSGKIQRFKVKQQLHASELDALMISWLQDKSKPAQARPGYIAPRTSIERAIAGIWASVLDQDLIGAEDNFFELGGDSIKATQIISQVQDVFQIQLDLRVPFDSPTIAGMAKMVVALRQAQH